MKLSEIKSFNKRFLIEIFVIALLTLPAIWSLIRPGFFTMYDDMQVIRVQQMDVCVKDGQIPCRWVPDLGYGYGYPLYIYYAPLPYYMMEGIHLLGFSYISTVKIGFIFSVFLSGLFFYLLSRKFFTKVTSLATSALYIYLPFRAADLYVRGAMGELWGMAALPFLLLGFEHFLRVRSKKSLVFFSFTIFIFLISHNLTIIMSLPLIIFWVLIRLYKEKISFAFAKKLILGLIIGFGLSSFYVIPLILERGLVHLESLTGGYFNYINHFLSLKQIFVSTQWGYGPSIVGASDDQFLGLGPIHFVAALLAIPVVFSKVMSKSRELILVLFGLMLIYLFMAHSRSTPLWKLFPFLEFIQFPWRFILIGGFISSFIFGFFSKFAGRFRKLLLVLLIFILLVVYGGFFRPKNWFLITDEEKLSGDSLQKQVTASIYDYLPKSAEYAPKAKAPEEPYFIDGEGKIEKYTRGTDWFKIKVNIETQRANLVIPTFDFPKWTVDINGQRGSYERFGDLGLLKITLDEGIQNIKISLNNSFPRSIGDIISLTSVFVLFGYAYGTNNKKTKSEG